MKNRYNTNSTGHIFFLNTAECRVNQVQNVFDKNSCLLKKSLNQNVFTALQIMHQHQIFESPIVDDKNNFLK